MMQRRALPVGCVDPPWFPTLRIVRDSRLLLLAVDASSFLARMRGLLGRPELGVQDALLLRPCRDVHTIGMRYTIDVAFLDKQGSVMKTQVLSPFRIAYCRGAHGVLEMREGTLEWLGIHVGQQLLAEPISDGY